MTNDHLFVWAIFSLNLGGKKVGIKGKFQPFQEKCSPWSSAFGLGFRPGSIKKIQLKSTFNFTKRILCNFEGTSVNNPI